MRKEDMTKRLAYEEALRTLPELADAIAAVFRKAMDANLSFEEAAKALGTDAALQAALHLKRIQTHATHLPFYYETLIEKLYTDYWLDNDKEDYIDE
jgi:hypothetical protein